MDVELHPEAEQEFSEAAYRYESRVVGLGAQFLDEFGVLKELLANNPKIGAQIRGPFRRAVFRRFPFSLVYTIEETRIWVIAVAHQHRRPGYWRGRHDR